MPGGHGNRPRVLNDATYARLSHDRGRHRVSFALTYPVPDHTMNTPLHRESVRRMLLRATHAFIRLIAIAALPLSAWAQSTGTVTGRVLNPATNEYVRNAEVRVEGTNIVATTEEGGYYRLHNVPARAVTVVATFPGAETRTASVNVTAGAVATHDFELVAIGARRTGQEVITLGAFVVETEREGQAKALAEQKQSMNVMTVMSADNFGDMSEGNIGEFLKYMPGISLEYVETDTRAARFGGMDPRYGYVTLDGNTQASGNSGSLGADSRQFEFESVSMNNIESIEVNKTLSADMSADAPGGTVNLRTRSALDLKRARFSYQVGFIWNSMENGFKRTPRHDDGLHAKTRPRFQFDYTNAFFNRKLGITINGAFTNIYKEQFRHALSYDYTSAQANAAGTPLITSVNFKDGPKIVEKSAGGIKIDYEPFRDLRLTGSVSYSYFDDFFANRNLNFVTNAANLGPGSSLLRVVATNNPANTNTSVQQTGESTGKIKDNTNLSLIARYKRGPWSVDTSLLYSRARETRGGLAYNTIGTTNVRLDRIGWTAERANVDSPTWYFTQTSGPDWYDYNSWGKTTAQGLSSNEAYGKTEEYTARIDVKRVMSWSIPTSYKAGFSDRVTFRHRWVNESFNATYVGPTGSALTSSMPQSKAYFLIDKGWGGGIGPLPVPDKEAMHALSKSNPNHFTQTEANLATDLGNVIGSFQGNQEDIRAGYIMQESRLGRWRLQAGLRNENTRTISRVPDEVPVNRNPFATRGTVTVGGVTRPTFAAANTRNYVAYRYSQGLVTSWGNYDDWLPSAAAKYQVTQDVSLKLGYNKAIKRPNLNNIAGPWGIALDNNTGDLTVTIPNPSLKPERSDKFSAMLEYYFKPAGSVSVHLFQTDITGAADETDPVPAAELGFGDDPEYGSAFFTTFVNLNQSRRIRGIELSYSQQLTFFRNEILRGVGFYANYSQYTATPRPRNGRFTPRAASGGLTWRFRKLFFSLNGTWTDEMYTGSNTVSANSRYFPNDNEFLKDRTILFTNVRYQLWRNLSVFVSGDRAYDSGKTWYFKSNGRIRQMERYGSQWSVGVKGEY